MNPFLTLSELISFENVVTASITARYAGDLQRWWDERNGGVYYTPLDTDNIRELLTTLWGDFLTTEAIEEFATQLIVEGAENWPRTWCEEDEDEKEERQARDLDAAAEGSLAL